jgi:hypothetical protein
MSRVTIAALAASFLGLTLPAEAQAFEVKHSAAGELVRWHHPKVEWTLDRSLRQVSGAEDAVVAAAAAWSERGGAPALSVDDRDRKLEPGFDGVSGVFYAKEGFAPAGAALAVTVVSFDERTGEMRDADIVLNGLYPFAPVSGSESHRRGGEEAAADPYDVRRVIAHEMGHALGLSDERALPDALMYPFVSRDVPLSASPGPDDLAGVTTLYGPRLTDARLATSMVTDDEEPAAASSGCAVAPMPASRAPSTTFVGIGLAVVALSMTRAARGGRRRSAAAFTGLAAAALVVLPPTTRTADAHASLDATAVVTNVRTTSVRGIFQTEVDLSTTACPAGDCPSISHAVVWGGTIDGITQVIGGTRVPPAGARVRIALERTSTPTRGAHVVRTLSSIDE